MISHFPQELVNRILGFLHDDTTSLLEAARVCRCWSTPIHDILYRSTICVVPVGTYWDDLVKPPPHILWTSSVLATIAERPELALRIEKISIWMSQTSTMYYGLAPHGYKDTYEFVHQLEMLLPTLVSVKQLKFDARKSHSRERILGVFNAIKGSNSDVLEELELSLETMPIHFMDLLQGTKIKTLSLEMRSFEKGIWFDAERATPSSLVHLHLDSYTGIVKDFLGIVANSPHLLPHLQQVTFPFEIFCFNSNTNSEWIIKALPMSAHEFKIAVTGNEPISSPIRYAMAMENPPIMGYFVNNVNGTADALYEASFDLRRTRGVENLSLRYEFLDNPRALLFAQVLDSWKASIELLVSLGHHLQRVTLAFPRFDILSLKIATAKTALEEILVRFGLNVYVEDAEEEQEKVRAAFPELDKLGLLTVCNYL